MLKYTTEEKFDLDKDTLELEKSIGFKRENTLEKAVSIKPITRHTRIRSGKPYYAGHGVSKLPRGIKDVPTLDEQDPFKDYHPTESQIAERYSQIARYEKARNFPKLSKEKQKLAGENIAAHMKHKEKHPGGRKQAIAIGIAQARADKKEELEKARSRGARDIQPRKRRSVNEIWSKMSPKTKRKILRATGSFIDKESVASRSMRELGGSAADVVSDYIRELHGMRVRSL
jgi:hypothetical protein